MMLSNDIISYLPGSIYVVFGVFFFTEYWRLWILYLVMLTRNARNFITRFYHCVQTVITRYIGVTPAMAESQTPDTGRESPKPEEGEEKRPQFGGRFLTNPEDVFQHNAWYFAQLF